VGQDRNQARNIKEDRHAQHQNEKDACESPEGTPEAEHDTSPLGLRVHLFLGDRIRFGGEREPVSIVLI
jgi:hypothetical protein